MLILRKHFFVFGSVSSRFDDNLRFLTIRMASTYIGRRWQKVYDDFIHPRRLVRKQNEVIELENQCLRSLNVRMRCQRELITAQTRLKDLHSQLENVSTVDKKYPSLFAEELNVLKQVRALTYDFHMCEEGDRTNYITFETALTQCQKEEWSKAKRANQFLVYACLVGLAFGIAGTATSIYLHHYFSKETLAISTETLQNLAVEVAAYIQSKNRKYCSFLQDVAILLGAKPSAETYDEIVAFPQSGDEDKVATLSWLGKAVPILRKMTDDNDAEMKRLRLLLLNHPSVESMLVDLPSENPNKEMTRNISALWTTTFTYGVLIVAVPVVYSLFS